MTRKIVIFLFPLDKVKKEEPKVRDDEILCCGGCGCYGMAGEFYSGEACSTACHGRILQKNREKEKKERELGKYFWKFEKQIRAFF